MSSSVEIRKLTTPQELFEAAAEEVVHAANQSVTERGRRCDSGDGRKTGCECERIDV